MLSEIPQSNEANFRLPSNERAWLHCETFYLLWGWQHRTWDSRVILSYFLLAESFLTNWKMYKLRFSSNHSKMWYITLHVLREVRCNCWFGCFFFSSSRYVADQHPWGPQDLANLCQNSNFEIAEASAKGVSVLLIIWALLDYRCEF